MKVIVDTKGIDKLTTAMKRYAQIMPTQKANSAFRKAIRPMLQKAQSEVPVSNNDRERVSLKQRTGKNANAYRRGGATKRDLRIKTVPPKAGEVGRVLMGVSKRGDKTGWRTIFITRGTKMRKTKSGANRGRMKANNFLQRAYDSTFPGVAADFQKQYREAFVQWAKTTWPQIKV
jgi:HK97 gp10 family phage protein